MSPKEAMEEMLALIARHPSNTGLIAGCAPGAGQKKYKGRKPRAGNEGQQNF
jgi:hypothetical protein